MVSAMNTPSLPGIHGRCSRAGGKFANAADRGFALEVLITEEAIVVAGNAVGICGCVEGVLSRDDVARRCCSHVSALKVRVCRQNFAG